MMRKFNFGLCLPDIQTFFSALSICSISMKYHFFILHPFQTATEENALVRPISLS